MEKPRNYDNVLAYGAVDPLQPGGYVCRVVSIIEAQSRTGKPMVKIALDIAEGEEAGRFMRIYEGDTRQDKKWPCIMYQLTLDDTGECSRRFKTFNEALEAENPGYTTQWGLGYCNAIKGKLLGVVFRREQYRDQNGNLKMSCKPNSIRSIADIRAGKVLPPEDKLLDDHSSYGNDFSQPAQYQQTFPPLQPEDPGDSFAAIDEDVPF